MTWPSSWPPAEMGFEPSSWLLVLDIILPMRTREWVLIAPEWVSNYWMLDIRNWFSKEKSPHHLHIIKVDNTSRRYDKGIVSGSLKSPLALLQRKRTMLRGLKCTRLALSPSSILYREKREPAWQEQFPWTPRVWDLPGNHALPGEGPVSCLVRHQVVPQCEPQDQLHNWMCNQYLPDLQPKTLQSCWIISKPHDWMIHWSPLGSWLSGVHQEMRTKFIRWEMFLLELWFLQCFNLPLLGFPKGYVSHIGLFIINLNKWVKDNQRPTI